MNKSILANFDREDLPNEGLRLLSDIIGIDSVKVVMLKLPGTTIHVPKTLYKQSDNNYLMKNKDKPAKELAYKMGCSLRSVYRKLKAVK